MRKRPALWVALFLLLVAGLGATAWRQWGGTWPARATEQSRSSAPTGASGNQFAIPVEGVQVTVATLTSEIRVIGSLHSNESVVIRPEVGGRVAAVLFEEGQRVTSGTPLIKLDQTIALAEVHQAEAALELSRANHQRTTELFERKAASAANRDQTLAALRADQANLELAQARLAKLTLTAPFDGVLGLRKVSVGDFVTPGQDIVNLEQIDPLKVDFRVAEVYVGASSVGQSITVGVDAFPGRSFAGQVYAIDPLIDESGRSILLRARLPNQDGALRPGLFASIAVVGTSATPSMVPEQALVPQGRSSSCSRWSTARRSLTKVKVGVRRNAMVEILEGLAPGDRWSPPASSRSATAPRSPSNPRAGSLKTGSMSLPELCIRRPVFASVLSLVVVLVGLMAYSRLPVREYPNIDEPVVSVTTDYTRRLAPRSSRARSPSRSRRRSSGHRGHRRDRPRSAARSSSQITVRFRIDRDPDAAAADVRDRVSRARGRLPDEVDEPVIAKVEADAQPIIYLAFSSDRHSPLEVTDFADRFVKDRLQNLPGVAEVRIFGERRYAMRIWLDRGAAGRLRPDAAGRRGRAAAAEHRGPGGPDREPAARVHGPEPRPTCARPSSSTT